MDSININLTIKAEDKVLELLDRIGTAIGACLSLAVEPQLLSKIREEAKAEAPAEEPAAQAAEQPQADMAGDMPDFTVQAPAEEKVEKISDAQLREAVAACKNRITSKGLSRDLIRAEIFDKYGIKASINCPPEKRAALLADLNAFHAE